jgi:SnoaL-like domain
MGHTWSRDELERAFRRHATTIAGTAGTGDWEPFVQLFTEDAEYHEPMAGLLRGHDAIRAWAQPTLAAFPGSAMTFPEDWHVVDEAGGRIVAKLRNVLRDPGDGSVHEQANITILEYAGDGRFRSEEDVYDPGAFIALIERWGRRSAKLGTLSPEERDWFAQNMPTALQA